MQLLTLPSPRPILAFLLTLLVTLLVAGSWLVFPYFIEGRQLLTTVGDEVVSSRTEQYRALGQYVTRYADGPGEAEVDVIFATEEYFLRTSTARAMRNYNTGDYLLFIVSENLHMGELPTSLARAVLTVDGRDYPLVSAEGPLETDHHRTTTLKFDRRDNGRDILSEHSQQITLTLNNQWDSADTSRSVSWELPIPYPDSAPALTSPMMIMALSSGLLSATLTPCLLQLLIVYMATMTGMSAEQMSRTDAIPPLLRRRMFTIALAFITGFTLFYTASGALIGYAGQSAQRVFSTYSQEISFAAGLLIVGLGLWMGIQSRAPLVCRLPAPKLVNRLDKAGVVRAVLMSTGFSLGCMVCFSGAIMGTLFLYVGILGSAQVGAAIMLIFSLGVAIPFLAAAWFLSRTLPVMNWVTAHAPAISFISMLIIFGFGLILMANKFHVVSNTIYPWLGLN